MIPSSFFFTCEESFRFLISTRCFAHFDSQSTANMISDMVRSEILAQQLPFRSQVQFSKHHFKLSNVAVIDLDSFVAIKSLRERLKGDFDDSKPLFFTCKESFRFLIPTRCSAHFDSQSTANMISDMVRSEILVQQLPFTSYVQL